MPTKIWSFILSFVLMVAVLGIASLTSSGVSAQSVTTGEWKASLVENNSKINLGLERRTEKSGRNQMGQTYEFSELQGLSQEQSLNGGSVHFSLLVKRRIGVERT